MLMNCYRNHKKRKEDKEEIYEKLINKTKYNNELKIKEKKKLKLEYEQKIKRNKQEKWCANSVHQRKRMKNFFRIKNEIKAENIKGEKNNQKNLATLIQTLKKSKFNREFKEN